MFTKIFSGHHGAHGVDASSKTSNTAKAAIKTLDKGARSIGTSLKRGLRNAVSNFNSAKLSAKVAPFDPDSVKRSKDFATGAARTQEQHTQERMNGKHAPSAQEMKTRQNQEARKQYMANWDREHLAPAPQQARPRPAPQPARPAPEPGTREHLNQFAMPLNLERPTAEQMRLSKLPIDYDTPEDDVRIIQRAQQQLREMDERNQARKTGHAQQQWKPTHDTSIPRWDTHTRNQREGFERVLDRRDHPDLSSSERKQLMHEQAHARQGLDELMSQQAVHNAGNARFQQQSKLLSARDRLDARMAKLDQNHPDFDWLNSHRAPAQRAVLANDRARITAQLKDLGISDEY